MEIVAASLATGAGAAAGPAGPYITAVGQPVLEAGLQRVVQHIGQLRVARSTEVFQDAARFAGRSDQDFADYLATDEQLLELAGRVLLAAQDMSLAEKRRALAQLLANCTAGGSGSAFLAAAQLLAAAITAIDEPHIRFLHALSPAPRRPVEAGDEGKYGMRLEGVVQADSELAAVAPAVLQSLLSLGLIEDATGGLVFLPSVRSYAVSDLGEQLLALLKRPS